jgi:hypothetical protein
MLEITKKNISVMTFMSHQYQPISKMSMIIHQQGNRVKVSSFGFYERQDSTALNIQTHFILRGSAMLMCVDYTGSYAMMFQSAVSEQARQR